MIDCSSDFPIQLWNIEKLLITDYIKDEFINRKYILDSSKISTFDAIEKYIFDITSFHLKNRDIDYNNCNIEFSIETQSNNFKIDYNKKSKKYPLFSIITFLDDEINPIIFTKIDLESYKYKEIPCENTFLCFKPSCFYQIVFDSSTYYGFYKSINTNGKFIKINVWDCDISDVPIYTSNEINRENDIVIITPVKKNDFYETLNYKNVINLFLYEKYDKISMLENILLKYQENSTIIINNKTIDYYDISFLEDIYGNMAKELYPFVNKGCQNIIPIENNRFYRNKIVQNILSKDICYWIINECEKIDNWETSIYPNYNNYLNIEKMPSILNFLLFVSNFWLMDIRKLYNFDDKISLNIKDVFISKYKKDKNEEIQNSDGSFLTLNIFINDKLDYNDGEIIFSDINEKIKINQGDMIIYNGKKLRTKGVVSEGVKYILVFLIDLHI